MLVGVNVVGVVVVVVLVGGVGSVGVGGVGGVEGVINTVSAKFNRTRVQTAPVTLLVILQTRQWYHLKELGIQLQKHPQHVKIDQLRPEKIEFKDYKSKLKMYVFGI